MYVGALWTAALAVFAVLSFTVGLAWSWLAILAALAATMVILARRLFPNGAGKSTTVKILATLARADSGSAAVAGLDVGRRPAEVRRALGFVAQRQVSDPTDTGLSPAWVRNVARCNPFEWAVAAGRGALQAAPDGAPCGARWACWRHLSSP